MNLNLSAIRQRVMASMEQSEPTFDSREEDYDPYIDKNLLARRLPLDNGAKLFKKRMLDSQTDDWKSCKLQSLPVELYQACLQYLDIATLTRMREVSQYTRFAIDSLYQYQELYKHAPQALRACLATNIAPHIPLLRLHNSLVSMECYYCKNFGCLTSRFGTYLSLYECRRSCGFCLRNSQELYPVEFMELATIYSHRNRSIRSFERYHLLRTITDKYGPSRTLTKATTLLLGAPVAETSSNLTDKETKLLFGNPLVYSVSHHPHVQPSSESDISAATSRYTFDNAEKKATQSYMSAIQFPYLTASDKTLEFGTSCEECNLHMQFAEHNWKQRQNRRRMHGQDPSASTRCRDLINNARERASIYYTTSESALKDQKMGAEKITCSGCGGALSGMSIQQHRLSHKGEVLSAAEREFREFLNRMTGQPPGNAS